MVLQQQQKLENISIQGERIANIQIVTDIDSKKFALRLKNVFFENNIESIWIYILLYWITFKYFK